MTFTAHEEPRQMDKIRQLLENLTTITAEQLAEAKAEINRMFDDHRKSTDPATAQQVAEMDELVTAGETVKAEESRRTTEAAEAQAKRDEAIARMDALQQPEPETATEPAKAEPAKTEPVTAETPPAAEPTASGGDDELDDEGNPKKKKAAVAPEADNDGGTPPVPEVAPDGSPLIPVAAGAGPRGTVGGMASRMAAVNGPATRSPNQQPISNARVLVAAGVPMATPGSIFNSDRDLAVAMSETLTSIKAQQSHSRALVASARWEYPEDRQLDDNVSRNTEKMDAVCAIGAPRVSRRAAGDGSRPVVASGGICLPTNVDYTVPTWTTADRPLRDGLASFQATRGGIQFVTPPDIGLASLQAGGPTGAGQATGIWSEGTDASPGSNTKPVWTVQCGSTVQVYVDAIPTRVKFGNMESRFAPEQVAANTQQAIAAAARDAEINLLEKIAISSKQICPVQFFGATRDILANADLLIAQYRESHRYDPGTALTAIFPSWAKSLIRADLARELAHDNAGSINVMAITDAQIEDYFDVRGVNIIWTYEGLPAGTYGTGGSAITNQTFPIATAGAAPLWPGQATSALTSFMCVWFLFIEGTVQFLDGGRLDLGVVRDSLLDATNDYETFVETFEGIAFRGNEIYQVQQLVIPGGASSATVTTAGI